MELKGSEMKYKEEGGRDREANRANLYIPEEGDEGGMSRDGKWVTKGYLQIGNGEQKEGTKGKVKRKKRGQFVYI